MTRAGASPPEEAAPSNLVRRYRDRFGCDACLLADRLDIPYGAHALSRGMSNMDRGI